MDESSHVNSIEAAWATRKVSRSIIVLTVVLLLVVGIAAWIAGSQYGRLRTQLLVSQLADVQQQATQLRVQVHEKDTQLQKLNSSMKTAGTQTAAAETEAMRRQILRLQAELNTTQTVSDRDREELAEKQQLVRVFSSPGVRLIPLRGTELASVSVAYSLVSENKRVVIIASSLAKAPAGRDYQLWIWRKNEPKTVSGGVFSPDDDGRVMFQFADGSLVSQVTTVNVTLEPVGGSDAPGGPSVYTSAEE